MWLEWQNYYDVHEGTVESQNCVRERTTKKECFETLTEDRDHWMSDTSELQSHF